MGREIRRVIAGWQHPKEKIVNYFKAEEKECYMPLYDQSCEEAWVDWMDGFKRFQAEELKDLVKEYKNMRVDEPYAAYCEWDGMPPDPKFYRPRWDDDDMTWWQVYETVSEGTPVSPPFETQDELVSYLTTTGDFWEQDRAKRDNRPVQPWPKDQAQKFVYGEGWAPTFAVKCQDGETKVEAGYRMI